MKHAVGDEVCVELPGASEVKGLIIDFHDYDHFRTYEVQLKNGQTLEIPANQMGPLTNLSKRGIDFME